LQSRLNFRVKTDDKFRHVRSHSEAAIMARKGVHGSILPEHWGCCAKNGTV